MFLKRLLLVFFLAPQLAFSNISLNNWNSGKLTPSKNDLKFARYLNTLTRHLRRGKVYPRTINAIVDLSKKSEAFKDFSTPLKNIKKTTQAKLSLANFPKYCPAYQSNKSTDFLLQKLNYAKGKYCRKNFLSLIKDKKFNELSEKSQLFFKESLFYFAKGESRTQFYKWLNFQRSLSDDSHTKVSKHLSKAIISRGITPRSDLLEHIFVDEPLTQYIQSTGLNNYRAKRLFKKEFISLVYDFRNSLKNNKFKKAKTQLNYALSFYQQNEEYIEAESAWAYFITNGKLYLKKGKIDDAYETFKMAKHIAPNHKINDSQFYMLWTYISQEDYSSTVKKAEELKLLDEFDSLSNKLKFWIAYSLERNGENTLAKLLYKKLSQSEPFSYYSITSLRELAKYGQEGELAKLLPKANNNLRAMASASKLPHNKAIDKSLKRLMVWLGLNYDGYAHKEIKRIVSHSIQNKSGSIKETKVQVLYGLMDILKDHQKFLHIFKIFYKNYKNNLFDFNRKMAGYLFPTHYLHNIANIDDSIDPYVVLSLIRQESAFNPNARSHVGARGLMQLMPATARQMNRRVKTYQLKNPSLNLKLGIKYLKKLMFKYQGNLIYSLAAYNAGPRRVENWSEKVFTSNNPLVVIESIPFSETRNYVKLIYRNLFFYQLTHNKKDPIAYIDETFKVSFNSEP